jgi:hypothetical protein
MIVQPSEAPKEAVICFLLLDKVLQQILKLPSTEIGTFHRSKFFFMYKKAQVSIITSGKTGSKEQKIREVLA